METKLNFLCNFSQLPLCNISLFMCCLQLMSGFFDCFLKLEVDVDIIAAYWQINSSELFSHTRFMQVSECRVAR